MNARLLTLATVVLLALAAAPAQASDKVTLEDGRGFIEADPDSPNPVKEAESEQLPFISSVSSGASFARMAARLTDEPARLALGLEVELRGADSDFAFADYNRRFTVTGDVEWRLEGTMSVTGQGGHQDIRLRVSGAPDDIFEHSEDDGSSFSASGTLAPGTYELVYGGECDQSSGETCTAALDAALELPPEPPAPPVIFIHGFLGSNIVCGPDELWPHLPTPQLPEMELARDGSTNAGCPTAGPVAGRIVESALGSDVYGSTVAFLRDLHPDDFHLYAWDWRKNPEAAVAGLDALIDSVRGDGKVVLMAHSMGGLVLRSYIENAARAAKVDRAVTIATPYWGAPKALFPFLYGVESPGFSTLDAFLDDDDMRELAKHLQGLFFLWPSARYGGWLSIEGRPSPLSRAALLDFVEERDGNRSLLATALGAHAVRLDTLRTNGVDYQTVIGSGVHTIGSVEIESRLLLPDRDVVHVDWTNGDGTVPLRSAIAATPAARRHFVCGISHVPLPGAGSVTARLRGFLLDGDPIASLPVSGVLCEPNGFALSVFALEGGVFASQAAPGALTFEQAEQQGRLEMLSNGDQIEAATSSKAPLSLALAMRRGAVRIAPLKNGRRGRARVYGPVGKGRLTISLGAKVAVKLNGKKVKARKDDKRAPKTRVRVTRRGGTAILRFKVKDASPVRTFVKAGKRVRQVKRRALRLPIARLRKGVRIQSIDAFGNAERPKRLRRKGV
jgi:pimeloyl-ACP methyl ester carboxylesterase